MSIPEQSIKVLPPRSIRIGPLPKRQYYFGVRYEPARAFEIARLIKEGVPLRRIQAQVGVEWHNLRTFQELFVAISGKRLRCVCGKSYPHKGLCRGYCRISAKRRKKVLRLLSEGHSAREVSRRSGVSRNVVDRIVFQQKPTDCRRFLETIHLTYCSDQERYNIEIRRLLP